MRVGRKEGRERRERERERSRLVAMGCYVRRRVYINTVRCGRKSAGGAKKQVRKNSGEKPPLNTNGEITCQIELHLSQIICERGGFAKGCVNKLK